MLGHLVRSNSHLSPCDKPVSEIGEFSLIERIKKILPTASSSDLILGIGDDAAVIRIDEGRALVATCDILVEDVHFRLANINAYQLGRRAIAVNQSDIASMGGRPTFALVSLALPQNLPVDHFDELFRGMGDQMREFSGHIIGGNIARSKEGLMVDVFMLGEVDPRIMLTRSGARPDDRIMVTGRPGASGAGLMILEKYGSDYPRKFKALVNAHLQPKPRVETGQIIAATGIATAMIDVSDGLAADLNHICEASGEGAELDLACLPLPGNLAEVAALAGRKNWEMALFGGEDYELLFTVKPETTPEEIDRISNRSNTPITEIGRITGETGVMLGINSTGERMEIKPKGWDHFG